MDPIEPQSEPVADPEPEPLPEPPAAAQRFGAVDSWFIGGTLATIALLILLGYFLFAYTSIPLR